jgi:hypothetical protein
MVNRIAGPAARARTSADISTAMLAHLASQARSALG